MHVLDFEQIYIFVRSVLCVLGNVLYVLRRKSCILENFVCINVALFLSYTNEQYGFVNHALELLVLRNYGPEVWEDIK